MSDRQFGGAEGVARRRCAGAVRVEPAPGALFRRAIRRDKPPAVSTARLGTSYAPAGLANGAPYFWQIVATNAAGDTTKPIRSRPQVYARRACNWIRSCSALRNT
jgi:hypothetical protein